MFFLLAYAICKTIMYINPTQFQLLFILREKFIHYPTSPKSECRLQVDILSYATLFVIKKVSKTILLDDQAKLFLRCLMSLHPPLPFFKELFASVNKHNLFKS